MGINFKLAFDGLRRNKQDTLATLSLAVIIFTILISIANIASIYSDAINQKELYDSGKWVYFQKMIDYEDYDKLTKISDEVATIENVGIAKYGKSYNVISLSENFKQLVNTNILKGEYPKAGEIALSSTLLSSLGYQGELGEMITLSYQDSNNNETALTAKLSGIIINEEIAVTVETNSTGVFRFDSKNDNVSLGGIILPPQPVNSDSYVSAFVYDRELIEAIETNNYYSALAEKLADSSLFTATLSNSAYNATSAAQFDDNIFFLAAFMIAVLITFTLMLSITLSSLERRTREFTLLRAIGQTKKQMLKMLLFQLLIVVSGTVVIGALLAVIITYISLVIIRKFIIENAVLLISLNANISMIVTGVMILFLGMFMPSYQASKKSLTGTFDDAKFKYFSVRYRKLNYQKMYRLAGREFLKNIKVNLILIIILAITFSYMNNLIVAYKNYDNNLVNYKDSLRDKQIQVNGYLDGLDHKNIEELESVGDDVYYGKQISCDDEGYSWQGNEESIIATSSEYDEAFEQNNGQLIIENNLNYYTFSPGSKSYQELIKYIDGKMPEKNNEVVVYLPYYQMRDGEYVKGSKRDACENTIELNTRLTVYEHWKNYDLEGNRLASNYQNIKSYKVVGIIRELPSNYLIQFSLFSLIINEDEYEKKFSSLEGYSDKYNTLFIKSHDRIVTLNMLQQLNTEKELVITDYSKQYQISEIELKEELDNAVMRALLMLVTSLFLFIYLSRYRIINYTHTIGILKSLGATRMQLYRLCGYQAIMICIGAIVLALWSILYTFYLRIDYQYPYHLYIFSFIIISMLIIFVYCIPLKSILKRNVLEIIKIKD